MKKLLTLILAATTLAAHDASEKIYREILWAIEHHGKK